MTVYAIEKNGNIVKHFVFEGDITKNHTLPHKVVDLTFDNEKSAIEVANHMNATVVKVA